MKREVDFIAEFEKENAELKQEKTNPSPPTEEEYRKLWLSMKLVDLKKSTVSENKKRTALESMDKYFLPNAV